MSEKKHLQLTIRALRAFKGDEHIRARLAFAVMSGDQMQMPHGQSGMSRAEALAMYEARAKACDDAIAWVLAREPMANT